MASTMVALELLPAQQSFINTARIQTRISNEQLKFNKTRTRRAGVIAGGVLQVEVGPDDRHVAVGGG
jgi:hypothetical protein